MASPARFLLVIGQSNATPIADAQTWEDLNTEVALRDPGTDAALIPRYTSGAYNDRFTMPLTFAGGPRPDYLAATQNGQWQTVDCRGGAVQAVHLLTFYNPAPAFLNYDSYVTAYPATAAVTALSTPSRIRTNMLWQQTAYYEVDSIAAGVITLTAASPFSVGDIVAFASSGTLPSAIDGRDAYRVSSSSGTDIEIETWPEGDAVAPGTSWTGTLRVMVSSIPAQIRRRSTGTLHTAATGARGRNLVSHYLTVSPPFDPPPLAGELIDLPVTLLAGGSSSSSKLAFDLCFGGLHDVGTATVPVQFYTRADGGSRAVARGIPLRVGMPIVFGGTLPSPLTAGPTYYVTRLESDEPLAKVPFVVTGLSGTALTVDSLYVAQLHDGEEVTFTATGGTLPPELVAGQYYYITVASSTTVNVSATRGGSAVSMTTGTGVLSFTRTEVNAEFYVSETPAGRELTWATSTSAGTATGFVKFDGSLTGLVMRCTAGANVGQTRALGDVEYDQTNDVAYVHVDPAWSNSPTDGDTFVVEPPTINGEAITFEEFGMFLPWSPFEGRSYGQTSQATVTFNAGGEFNLLTAEGIAAYSRAKIRFWVKDGYLPPPLVPGRDYFTKDAAGTATFLSLTDDGDAIGVPSTLTVASVDASADTITFTTPHKLRNRAGIRFTGLATSGISGTSLTDTLTQTVLRVDDTTIKLLSYSPTGYTDDFEELGLLPSFVMNITGTLTGSLTAAEWGSGTMYAMLVDQADRAGNPFPPGFNFPNHYDIPFVYQPFRGPGWAPILPGISVTPALALRLHEYYGEKVYAASCAFGGTSAGHKEVLPVAGQPGYAWMDTSQQLSWAPGEPNGCFARLETVLRSARRAFTLAGITDVEARVIWLQGEEDARIEQLSLRYESNSRRMREAVRQLLVDNGLHNGPAATIPWLHPKIRARWTYAAAVNAAIASYISEDPRSRTFEIEDLDTIGDDIHYNGASVHEIAARAFAALVSMEQQGTAVIDVCNLALSMIGETSKVTSIDPPDGSVLASLCATFYPLARDQLLEEFPWDFAIRRTTPTIVESGVTQWPYLLTLPPDFLDVVSLLPVGSDADEFTAAGQPLHLPYRIELDDVYKRRMLLTTNAAVLRYKTKAAVDPALFSRKFVVACATSLAAMLAGPVVKGDVGAKLAENLERLARLRAREATAHNAETRHRPAMQQEDYEERDAWGRGG